jgi:hypothetical protein
MTVIDTDPRFTFKVDHGRRIGHTITKNTILRREVDYQEASDYQKNEIHLVSLIP